MMGCTISDFRDKEVINVCDGQRLGYVIDVEFDTCSGRILALLVPGPRCGILNSWKSDGTRIPWDKIQRIGEDIILVELDRADISCQGECEPRPKRRFF